MNIQEYSDQALTTLTTGHKYGEMSPALLAQVLGIVGEGGEVAEKFKKIIRDKDGVISEEDRLEIIKELGDILWYVNAVAKLVGSNLDEVASKNLEKVLSRKSRGTTHGSGDNR